MKKIIPLLFTLFIAVACQKPEPTLPPNPEPTPTPSPTPTPNPTPQNSFKALFTANPSIFSAQGGDGIVEGILQEFSPEGKMVSEKALKKDDFMVALKSGDATQITIDNTAKTFVITNGEAEALFVLEAKVINKENLSQELTIKRKKAQGTKPTILLPLEYVTEYNMNPEGSGFVTTHATDGSGLFSFKDAVAKFKDITISGKKYHLPSKEEWLAIVPEYARRDYVNFAMDVIYDNISETVVVGGKTITSSNDYRGNVNGIAYALRYKGTEFFSAWKYEFKKIDNHPVLSITARPVGSSVTINDIMKPIFWETDASMNVVRIFPACGFSFMGELESVGSYGYYWSSSDDGSGYAWAMNYRDSFADVYSENANKGTAIRLFYSDN